MRREVFPRVEISEGYFYTQPAARICEAKSESGIRKARRRIFLHAEDGGYFYIMPAARICEAKSESGIRKARRRIFLHAEDGGYFYTRLAFFAEKEKK